VEDQTDLTSAKNEQDLITKYLDKNKEFDTGLWNKIFRRSLIQGHQLRFNNGNFFEDSLFNLRYLLNCRPGKVVFIKQTLYDLYKTSGTTTTSFNPKSVIGLVSMKISQAILNSRDYMSKLRLSMLLRSERRYISSIITSNMTQAGIKQGKENIGHFIQFQPF
jgi:hypothetical protein